MIIAASALRFGSMFLNMEFENRPSIQCVGDRTYACPTKTWLSQGIRWAWMKANKIDCGFGRWSEESDCNHKAIGMQFLLGEYHARVNPTADAQTVAVFRADIPAMYNHKSGQGHSLNACLVQEPVRKGIDLGNGLWLVFFEPQTSHWGLNFSRVRIKPEQLCDAVLTAI